jgi:uncharacterized membrane protein YdbT with pleckstrin-like domain
MPYPQQNLHANEELVLDLHPHWWTVTPAFLTLVAAVVLAVLVLVSDLEGAVGSAVNIVVALAVLATLVWFGFRLLQLRTTNFVLTTDRVIYRSGIVSKRGVEIPLESINAIHFDQRVWERMLGLGDLRIDSASVAGSSQFDNIRHPNQVQNQIYLFVDANDAEDRGLQLLDPTTNAPAVTTHLP